MTQHIYIHDEGPDRSKAAKKGWLHRQRARAKSGAQTVTRRTGIDPGSVGKGTAEIMRQHFSEAGRKANASRLLHAAKVVPKLIGAMGREEKEKAIHAAGAIKSLATGKKPSSEQWKGLRQFSTTILFSAGIFAVTGDPTGSIGHVAAELGQELIQHTIIEHGGALLAGGARMLGRKAHPAGADRARDADDDIVEPLQRWVTLLAKGVMTMKQPGETDDTSEGAEKAWAARRHHAGFGGLTAAKAYPEGFVQGVGGLKASGEKKPEPEKFQGYDTIHIHFLRR